MISAVVFFFVLFNFGALETAPSQCRSNSDERSGFADTFVPCDLLGNQSCFQLVIPSTKIRPSARIYGCANDSAFPPIYAPTKHQKGLYQTRHQMSLAGKDYIGALKCCAVNRCNELDFVVIEPLKQRMTSYIVRFLDHHYPFLVMLALFFVSVYPVVKSYRRNKQFCRQEFADNGKPIEPLLFEDSTFGSSTEEIVLEQVSGSLQSVAQVNAVLNKLHLPTTLNQRNADLLREIKEPRKIPAKINETVRTFEQDSARYVRPLRMLPSKYENLLQRLIEHGPGLFDFDPVELTDLFDQAADVFAAEPTLLSVPPPAVIYGDLRGQYPDLHRWFHIHGYPPNRRKHVFLGGLLNNLNDFSLEAIALVIALKVALPYDVFVVRGAAEALTVVIKRRFTRKICRAMAAVISRMCSHMPLAVNVGGRILCVHGGPSHLLEHLSDIPQIPRPIVEFEKGRMSSHLVFSDPTSEVDDFVVKKHGRGIRFGPQAVTRTCQKMKIDLIIRGRNPVPGGYFMMANRKLLSLFSAPGDSGCVKGACALIDSNLSVRIVRLAAFGNLKTATVGDSLSTVEKRVDLLILEEPVQQPSSLGSTLEKNTTGTEKTADN